ncbi:hypothetical protein [Gordonia amicalis]|uniref:hypothetical protein n=1 Tax=Gordonia amicalis TaxID=89053 RepID=UPI0024BA22D6|nr:hypothetical protein [Gordonia amicalis]MDJ0454396.1 hypothetical protein [Gordonia amicalis]MDV7077715.1 hypothetical protein [Gordonia amicalis]
MSTLDLDAIEARQFLADAVIDRGQWDDVAESQADVPALVARVRELEAERDEDTALAIHRGDPS